MVVHRLLAASLNLAPLPAKARDRGALHSLADNLNARHRNAQFAGRASVELHTLIFFHKRTVVADARIIRVRGKHHGYFPDHKPALIHLAGRPSYVSATLTPFATGVLLGRESLTAN